ncbi:MAG: deoxynucleoside kinase [Candidatus Moranbacteria bacterium]|nr:deoxynucleoside kinase [Candidatus Moranbacteria bacterium]
MPKGKLIVIDGLDGAGKATQAALLVARLKKEGKKVVTLDFPQYQNNFFGAFIGECLASKHGDFLNLSPHIASVLYASDRFEASVKIKRWLKEGKYVVLDRYVSANQIHQGGKIKDIKERKKFLEWLSTMEYGVFQIPRPDKVIFLDVTPEVTRRMLENQVNKKDKKIYLGKDAKDVVEESMEYMLASRVSALWIAKTEKNWTKISCIKGQEILPREVIAEKVYQAVTVK